MSAVAVSEKSDKFIFSIVDEEAHEEINDISCDILIMYEKPVLLNKKYTLALVSNNTLLVNKGAFAFIARQYLNVVDFKNSGVIFRYMVKALPKAGTLSVNGTILKVNETFSQEDINNGNLVYQNDDKAASEWDFFGFTILDKDGNVISDDTYPIKIIADNTPPVLIHKKPLPVHEADKTVITKATLYAEDKEQGPEEIYFDVVYAPKYGCLTHLKRGIIKKGGMFTQQDIDKEQIEYKHFGESKKNDTFCFLLSDGTGGLASRATLEIHVYAQGRKLPTTSQQEHKNTLKAAAPSQELVSLDQKEKKKPMFFFPVNRGGRSIISEDDMEKSRCKDERLRWDTIVVTEIPKYGKIFKGRVVRSQYDAISKGAPIAVDDELKIEEFKNSLISYQHHSRHLEEDHFSYKIMEKGRMLCKGAFGFTIVEDNTAPILMENEKLIVKRGTEATLTDKYLMVTDAEQGPDELNYKLLAPTSYGNLMKDDNVLTKGSKFSQSDINNGKVLYCHRGKECKEDHAVFSVDDGAGGLLDKVIYHIAITEKNFSLLNNNPLSVKAEGIATFTNNNLKVITTGDEPLHVKYKVTTLPVRGELLLDGKALEVGTTFTQEQIENGKLSFQHQV